MNSVHIYSEPGQPLTRFRDGHGLKPRWHRTNPRHQFHCHLCGRKRWAANLRIQVYYDRMVVFCAAGCKKGKRA